MMKISFDHITQKEPPLKALSMEEYADFVWFFLKDADPGKARSQKLREEHITVPFSFDEACAVQTKSVKDKVKSITPKLIAKFPAIAVLYMFGSQASGAAAADSDVDFAICISEQALNNQPLLDLEVGNFLEKHIGINEVLAHG